MKPKAQKAIDARIAAAFNRTCAGIQIDVMDISKIFAAGRAAVEVGADDFNLDATIRAYVETLRKN